ncbi:HesA/MoeB/ThiF family protein [Methanolobus profundi]|uniref:Adenylyltransferase and sulfurtransferase n=1 Tax=Methanolobus profundi TaxID=487685 RepID=A0A1I4USQ3_9EURY|nr:HesA/MoeB/ThiF family protein [Methanolobus profundi]SFM92009.1 adenylyltransferase and sulfurtransferase [Methanolobus profundi]
MFSEDELERYSRQTMLFGEDGQKRLKDATVFIAGAGGLGCPVALYLAAAGVGNLVIADRDTVERTNLNRQVLHWESDIGREKVLSVKEKLHDINPHINVETFYLTIDHTNIRELVGDADIIIDAMDNYPVRYLLNQVAHEKGIPLVHGAIRGFDGQAMTIVPGESACFNCVFPSPPPTEVFPVVGVTPGIIAMIQVNEAIKYLLGTGELLTNRLLIWNGLCSEMEYMRVSKRCDCKICAEIGNKQE